jgi:hypothetical protein
MLTNNTHRFIQFYSMERLQSVAALNNLGVNLLESKDTACAIQAFQTAIGVMKEFTSFFTSQDSADGISLMETPRTNIEAPRFKPRTGARLEVLEQGIYYTFDKSFTLPTDFTVTNDEDFELLIVTASAVLVFNFGMACHQFGKQQGHDKSLRQAVNIYELVLRMVHEQGVNAYFGKVLFCLALNNLANLHSDLCEYSNCETCLKFLEEILRYDAYIDLFAHDFLDEMEWFDVKQNLMYAKTPSAAHAA